MRRRTAYKVAKKCEETSYFWNGYRRSTIAIARAICQRYELSDPRAPWVESDAKLRLQSEMRLSILESALEGLCFRLGVELP